MILRFATAEEHLEQAPTLQERYAQFLLEPGPGADEC
jgi:hypothetical protein